MSFMNRKIVLLLAVFVGFGCNPGKNAEDTLQDASGSAGTSHSAITEYSATLPLEKIKMPPGFQIQVFAEVDNARSMALSPSGIVYVGNRHADKVYAVQDVDGDGIADKRWVLASGLNTPNGVAFKDGDLYIAEISRILKLPSIETRLDNPPAPEVVTDKYPDRNWHGWKYIAFGPDGKLYVPVGAPCNVCEPEEGFAVITRVEADGSGKEIVASGVRNSVGLTWHPETKELWFTDNGRDYMGDDLPPCELNHAPREGMHFGFPYCHAGSIPDPEFGKNKSCEDYTKPVQPLRAHVAALGLKFYTGGMFPGEYKNQVFIAEHGSWNRSRKIGYRVSLVRIENNTASAGYEPFASGWLDEQSQQAWGRPVDVLVLDDGSMLVSDDQAGVLYRITYKG